MDTPYQQPPGEQPATSQEPAAQAGENPLDSGNLDIASVIQSADTDFLMSILDGNPPPVFPDEQQPEPQPAEQPAPIEQPGEQPAPQAQDGTRSFQRLSVRGIPHDEQQLLADALKSVRAGEYQTIAQAVAALSPQPQVVNGGDSPPGDHEDAQAPAQAEKNAPQSLDDLNARLASLREQRAQASADFDQAEINRVTNDIEDTLLEIQVARIEERQVQAQVRTYQQEYAEAVSLIEDKYGQLLDDPDSPFGEFLDNAVKAAKADNDPILADPRFVAALADKIAGQLGITSGTAPERQVARVPSQLAPPPVRPSRPVGSAVAPGSSQAPRYTQDQIRQLIESAPIEALEAVAFTR